MRTVMIISNSDANAYRKENIFDTMLNYIDLSDTIWYKIKYYIKLNRLQRGFGDYLKKKGLYFNQIKNSRHPIDNLTADKLEKFVEKSCKEIDYIIYVEFEAVPKTPFDIRFLFTMMKHKVGYIVHIAVEVNGNLKISHL